MTNELQHWMSLVRLQSVRQKYLKLNSCELKKLLLSSIHSNRNDTANDNIHAAFILNGSLKHSSRNKNWNGDGQSIRKIHNNYSISIQCRESSPSLEKDICSIMWLEKNRTSSHTNSSSLPQPIALLPEREWVLCEISLLTWALAGSLWDVFLWHCANSVGVGNFHFKWLVSSINFLITSLACAERLWWERLWCLSACSGPWRAAGILEWYFVPFTVAVMWHLAFLLSSTCASFPWTGIWVVLTS